MPNKHKYDLRMTCEQSTRMLRTSTYNTKNDERFLGKYSNQSKSNTAAVALEVNVGLVIPLQLRSCEWFRLEAGLQVRRAGVAVVSVFVVAGGSTGRLNVVQHLKQGRKEGRSGLMRRDGRGSSGTAVGEAYARCDRE